MAKKSVPAHDPETGEIHDQAPHQEPFLRSLGLRPVVLDDYGREVLDPTPMAPPIGYRPQATMVDIIHAQIRSAQLAKEAQEAGFETFEEADDFDVDDDFDPSSPYEEMFDPAPPRRRFETAEEQLGRRKDRPARPQMAPEGPPSQEPTSPAPKVEPAAPPAPSSKEGDK